MLRYVKGDIIKSDCDIICHQVNCRGVMNAGLAREVRQHWPKVYELYTAWCRRVGKHSEVLLGEFQAVEIDNKRYIVNIFAQNYYGSTGERYTNYEAFYKAISKINEEAPKDKTIAFPYKIGCGYGGGSWNIIKAMLEEVFKNREIYIYHLEDLSE